MIFGRSAGLLAGMAHIGDAYKVARSPLPLIGVSPLAGLGLAMTGGALLGGINSNNSMVGGAGGVLGGGFKGALTGGFMGALYGAGRMGLGAYGARLGAKSAGRWIGAGAARYGALGAALGAAVGIGYGVLKAGIGSNRPVNRIRGLQ